MAFGVSFHLAAKKSQAFGAAERMRYNITTHSTRADIAWMSFARLKGSLNASRRVNSGVRHLGSQSHSGLKILWIYLSIAFGGWIMSTSAQNLIESFDKLPESEKQEVASVILRRTINFDMPALSDEELVLSAEEIFLELDRREAEDAQS
jgi:hypothetical protein